jgi:hypothetical protein
MPSNAFAGFRNGFYGMSRAIGSRCLVATTNCSSQQFMCFDIEGLRLTPLAYEQSRHIPICIGDNSVQCKIEYPCPADTLDVSNACTEVLRISRAIYTLFNVYDCTWFLVRDVIIIAHLVLVFAGLVFFLIAPDKAVHILSLLIRSTEMGNLLLGNEAKTVLGCDSIVFIAVILAVCSLLWEIVWAIFLLYLLFIWLPNAFMSPDPPSSPYNAGPASVRLVP